MSETSLLVKALRQSGLSQSEIHRRTGIPQPRLSRWEAGGAPASADGVLKLQRLLTEVAAADAPTATQPQEAAA